MKLLAEHRDVMLPMNYLYFYLLTSLVLCSGYRLKTFVIDEIDDKKICQQLHVTIENEAKQLEEEADDNDYDDDGDYDDIDLFSHSPIDIVLKTSSFSRGQSVEVIVSSALPFTGLLLQARWPARDTSVGKFIIRSKTLSDASVKGSLPPAAAAAAVRVITCENSDDTLVATFQDEVKKESFLWMPPQPEVDAVQFLATAFLSRNRIRRNVTSVLYSRGFPAIDLSSCGKTKGCFRYTPIGWSTCDVDDCQYVLTYHMTGTEAHFEMSGKAQWIAVGLSSDDKMGGDDVFVCVRTRNQVEVRRYITELRYQTPKLIDLNPFYNSQSEARDGMTSCRFTRPLKVINDQSSIDLNAAWYQLYAWGPVSSSDSILDHSLERPPTSKTKITLRSSRNEIYVGSSNRLMTSFQVIFFFFVIILSSFIVVYR